MQEQNQSVNTFDIDGVITIGLYPGPNDIIITGRSYEEAPETYQMLRLKGIKNAVYFNPLPWAAKTRESSGTHKAHIIKYLLKSGVNVRCHMEDDEVQKAAIESALSNTSVVVVHIKHSLTELENVKHEMVKE